MRMRRAGFAVRKSLHGRSLAKAETTHAPREAATKIVNAMILRSRIMSLSVTSLAYKGNAVHAAAALAVANVFDGGNHALDRPLLAHVFRHDYSRNAVVLI